MSGRESSNQRGGRKLRCEPLEERQMLSANAGLLPKPGPTAEVGSNVALVRSIVDNSLGARDQSLAISAVHFSIDGREVTLTSLDDPLIMEVGSSLQVVGIDYRLNGDQSVEGKIAFEGYLNKLRGSRVRTDYGDGRFGGHVQQGELPFGSSSHPGLEDAWEMEAGSESLTLVMVRYGADGVAVEDRVTIRTQVGTPDFVMDPNVRIQGASRGLLAGRSVKIHGSWSNLGEGKYRSYAEVDIYHESDPNKIVWSGTLADVVEAGESDKGRFVNKVKRDGFSRNWVPELGGTYTLKFYADPENQWNEADEGNNVHVSTIEVEDVRYRPRGRDAFFGEGLNHHQASDAPARDAALALASEYRAQLAAQSESLDLVAPEAHGEVVDIDPVLTIAAMSAHKDRVAGSSEATVTVASETAEEREWVEAIDLALVMPGL